MYKRERKLLFVKRSQEIPLILIGLSLTFCLDYHLRKRQLSNSNDFVSFDRAKTILGNTGNRLA